MTKTLWLLFFSGFVFLLPFSATVAQYATTTVSALPDIETLSQRWSAAHVQGRFIEKKTIVGFPKPLISHGTFTIDNETGVRWETLKPFPNVLEFNSQGIRYTSTNTHSGLSSKEIPAEGQLADLIRGILAGDLKVLSRVFDLRITKEETLAVVATPNDKNMSSAVAKIVIYGDKTIEKIRLFSVSGDITDLELLDVERSND